MEVQSAPEASLLTSGDMQSTLDRNTQFSHRAQALEDLGDILFEFYKTEGPVDLLPTVIELYRAYASMCHLMNTDAPHSLRAWIHLGDVMLAQHQLRHDVQALENSIRCYSKAIAGCANQSYHSHGPSISLHLNARIGFAYALYHRFLATRCIEDGQKAVEILTADLEHLPLGEYAIDRAWATVVLVIIKTTPYVYDWVIALDLKDIKIFLSTLTKLPTTRLRRSRYVLSLVAEAKLYNRLFFHNKEQGNYMDTAMRIINMALCLSPVDAEVIRHITLDFSYALAFNRHVFLPTGDNSYLDAADETIVRMRNNAKSSTVRLCESLSRRSNTLKFRALQNEDIDALEQAIEVNKQVIALCPPTYAVMLSLVSDLVSSLCQAFEHTGRVSLLDDVITLQQTQEGLECATWFTYFAGNVSRAMLVRAQVSDDTTARTLVDRAIEICTRRLNASLTFPVGIAERGQLAVELSVAHTRRLRDSGSFPPSAIINAVLALDLQLMELNSETSAKTLILVAKAQASMQKTQMNQDPQPILDVQRLLNQELVSEDMISSIYRVDVLAAYADLLVAQSDLQGTNNSLLSRAWEMYRHAATAVAGRAKERFQASLRWAKHASQRRYAADAFAGYSLAVEILPQVVFLGEDEIGRMEALRQVNGLAASSVAAALVLEDIPSAVQFMEHTRGVLWLQSFQARAPLDSVPPPLKEKFIDINRQLEDIGYTNWTARRHKAEELARLIVEIREVGPRCRRFLLPPLVHEIQHALENCNAFAVVIAPGPLGCDVIIFGAGNNPCHLRLSTLNIDQINGLSRDFSKACTEARAATRETMRKISRAVPSYEAHQSHTDLLSELWTSLVSPIFARLCLKKPSDSASRKRLWWCPIGALSSVPIHAAGTYDQHYTHCTGEYVVSSYAPSLSALHRLLTRNTNHEKELINNDNPQMLLVGQSESSSGLDGLPNAQVEINCIQNLVPPECLLNVPNPHGMPVKDALTYVSRASVLHLACHGHQDQNNPLNSGFDLQDGLLTLGQLMRVSTSYAQLAYLSACESAGIDESRPDEGLNLAGGMISIGFRSVIATLWAMNDIDGPFMAERVYKRLFRSGRLDLSVLPYALDDAARELRELGAPPSRWATYVHFGV